MVEKFGLEHELLWTNEDDKGFFDSKKDDEDMWMMKEKFTSQKTENQQKANQLIDSLGGQEWDTEFSSHLSEDVRRGIIGWKKSDKNKYSPQNIEKTKSELEKQWCSFIKIKWFNIPIIKDVRDYDDTETLIKILEEIPEEMKENMNNTLSYIKIIWGAKRPEFQAELWENNIWIILSGWTDKEFIKKFVYHEFTHIQHLLMICWNEDFYDKITEINKDWLDTVVDRLPEINISDTAHGVRWSTMVNEEYDKNRHESLSEYEYEWKIVLKEFHNKNGSFISLCKNNPYYEERKQKYNDDIDEEWRIDVTKMNWKDLNKFLRILQQPVDWFIIPYSAQYKRIIDKWNVLWLWEWKIFAPEDLSTLCEVYCEDKEYFFNICMWDTQWNALMLDEIYDKDAKYPKLRQKLRLMIEYWFLWKWQFDSHFEKPI